MDTRRFDGLTKALAAATTTTTTRRAGLLAALAAAMLPATGSAQDAAACLPDGTRCARRKQDRGKPCRRCCSGSSVRAGKRFRCASARVPIATGQPCDPAVDTCADAAAGVSCRAYTELAGEALQRTGTYCLFASPGSCTADPPNDPVCTGGFCSGGQCGDIELVETCGANTRSCTDGDLFVTLNPTTAAACLCVVDAAGNDVAIDLFDLASFLCSSNNDCPPGRVCWLPPDDVACSGFPASSYCALPC